MSHHVAGPPSTPQHTPCKPPRRSRPFAPAAQQCTRSTTRTAMLVQQRQCLGGSAGLGRARPLAPRAPVGAARSSATRQQQQQLRSSVRAVSAGDRGAAPRLIQHKAEAFWFYRFLSIVYDHIVNPGHWTEDMRTEALVPAKLDSPDLKVVDVGGGTGFCTLGVVQSVDPKNVTLIDQSPHQLAKARAKPALQGVTILEGDAEDLPFAADSFDRYVSAGSIEYWPEPQRGITEAYRVVKPGGVACVIGPVHPTHPVSRFFADVWMLFPKEEEYVEWFTRAGFSDVRITRIGPKWYRGVRRHGLIMGCSVTGVKPKAGPSPLDLGPKAEERGELRGNPLSFLLRLLLGTAAGFYYFLVPIYMYLKHLVWPKDKPM